MVLDVERRAALLGAKLEALVPPGEREGTARATFSGGAALVGPDGAWVLVDGDPRRSLGPALAWCAARDVVRLDLVVDDHGGLLARRAAAFASPPAVWVAEGQDLRRADPEPPPTAPALHPAVAGMAAVLVDAGCEPVVEHGRLVGEVLGLEVARVTMGPDGPVLEVGVGRFDREAHAVIAAGGPRPETVATVARMVRAARLPGALPSPLTRLAPERRLRSALVADPSLVGARALRPVPPVVEAPDLRTPWPAPAAGVAEDGSPVVVVCSSGIDLDLVPAAAEAREVHDPGARLVLALPERDAVPPTRRLAATLATPAEVIGL